MRLIALVFLCLFAASASAEHYHVVLRFGQSNAGLRGKVTDLPATFEPLPAGHLFAWRCSTSAGEWGPMRLNRLRFGVEQSQVRALVARYPERKYAFIVWQENGTNARSWVRSLNAVATDWVNVKLAELTLLGHTYEIAGVDWIQGEGDGRVIGLANSYENNLRTLVSRWQSSWTPAWIVLTKIAPTNPEYALYNPIVRAAMDSVSGDTTGVYTVDAAGLPLVSDGVHLSAAALVTLGELMQEAIP